jgi:hypothetical protein
MRGNDEREDGLFNRARPESWIPSSQPLRLIRGVADEALNSLRRPVWRALRRGRTRLCCTEAKQRDVDTKPRTRACYLIGTVILRSSERQHPVQGSGGEGDLGRLGPVGARSKGIADYTFVSPDRRSDLGPQILAAGFLPDMRPGSAIIRRWRSRCVGAVSTEALATAPARGGTMTAASG